MEPAITIRGALKEQDKDALKQTIQQQLWKVDV